MENSFVGKDVRHHLPKVEDPHSLLRQVHFFLSMGKEPSTQVTGQLKRCIRELRRHEGMEFIDNVAKTCDGEFAYKIFKWLSDYDFLRYIDPDVAKLTECPQKKRGAKVPNALVHTLRVLKFCNERELIWCGLYHDVGKLDTIDSGTRPYFGHELYSAQRFYLMMIATKSNVFLGTRFYYVIRNHMEPHDYQRRVKKKWTPNDIHLFMVKCGGLGNALMTVDLAIADKRASHNVDSFIEPYEELKQRCIEMADIAPKHSDRILCPICLAKKSEEIELQFKTSGLLNCSSCGTVYRLGENSELIPLNLTYVDAEIVDVKKESSRGPRHGGSEKETGESQSEEEQGTPEENEESPKAA